MKQRITSFLRSISVFVITLAACASLLWLTALIPQSAISGGVSSSADYFDSHELFSQVIDGQFNTMQDNYGDCLIVSIMYNIGQKDGQSLASSLVEDSYYQEEYGNVNEGLRKSVDSGIEANTERSRYWHGSMVLLRPMFTFTDITGVRWILGILTHIMMIIGAVLLWKRGCYSYAVVYLISTALINSWMFCYCVEYMMTFLIMGIINIAVIEAHCKIEDAAVWRRHTKRISYIMIVSGVVTCFLDLLTTETVTFTVPLLTELILTQADFNGSAAYRNGSVTYQNGSVGEGFPNKKTIRQYCIYILYWGFSYAAMFAFKWVISYIVLGKKAFKGALSEAALRMNGTVYLGNSNLDPTADAGQRLSGSITHNLCMFFPFRKNANIVLGTVGFLLIVFAVFAIVYVFRSKQFKMAFPGMLLLIGLIPYIRFLLLSNHAYMHYFFTYRAQIVTVMVLLYICWEYGLKNVIKTGAKTRKRSK